MNFSKNKITKTNICKLKLRSSFSMNKFTLFLNTKYTNKKESDIFVIFFYKPLTSKWIVSSKNGSLVSYLIADFFFFTNRPDWLKKNNFTYGSKKYINQIKEPNESSVFTIILLNWYWSALRQFFLLFFKASFLF